MATNVNKYPGPDDLDELKRKRTKISLKIDGLEKQILELKEKDSELAKKIFEREDGRILNAAKRAMMEHPEFKLVLDRYREALDIAGATPMPSGRRGRPPKAVAATQIDQQEEPNPDPILMPTQKKGVASK